MSDARCQSGFQNWLSKIILWLWSHVLWAWLQENIPSGHPSMHMAIQIQKKHYVFYQLFPVCPPQKKLRSIAEESLSFPGSKNVSQQVHFRFGCKNNVSQLACTGKHKEQKTIFPQQCFLNCPGHSHSVSLAVNGQCNSILHQYIVDS